MRSFNRNHKNKNGTRRNSSRRPKRVYIAPPPASAHEHARKIADAVVRAWYRARGAADPAIPVSVVASLSFISPPVSQRNAVAQQLLALRPHELATLTRAQWAIFVNTRPDLVNRAWPLMRVWHSERAPDEATLRAAKAAADAAVRAGLLALTGDERRYTTDLFGPLLTFLRPQVEISTKGQEYTPGEIADFIGRMSIPEEGRRVLEPAAGTGGLLRAAAQAMREQGRDPTTVEWFAVDIDELAIACLAINVVLWDLGGKVVLGVGNSLKGNDWIHRALAERRETIELAQTVRRDKLMLQLLSLTKNQVRAASNEQSQPKPPRATQPRAWHRRKT